ncbi:hypothetical protein ACTFQT_17295 [Bacillus cereus group sp. MYBK32-1]|uniref:hypothetical protein n=1 Tax=Bacillus cereus group sp. MYBK32-1 TaxID=3450632 RepID=UPI0005394BAB
MPIFHYTRSFLSFIGKSYPHPRIRQNELKVEIAQPSLTIWKLTQPQNDTKENIAKRYLKGEVNGARAQQEQVTTEKMEYFNLPIKKIKPNFILHNLTKTIKYMVKISL